MIASKSVYSVKLNVRPRLVLIRKTKGNGKQHVQVGTNRKFLQ